MLDGNALTEIEKAAGKAGLRQASLARLNSFGSGGPAALVVEAEDSPRLAGILRLSEKHGLPWFVVGKGTNLLVADEGFDGVVIYLSGQLSRCSVQQTSLVCGAGVTLHQAANAAAKNGLSGMEALANIPGTIGGAVAMNAGAFGTQIGDLIQQVEACGPGDCRTLPREELEFGYRSSNLPKDMVVAQVILRLVSGEPQEIRQNMASYRQERKIRQPQGQRSFGSVFKNPPGNESAGSLLERAGCKTLSVGGAAVSTVHANFIVNTGTATTADAIDLMNQCRRRVHENFGVALEPEVRFLGNIGLKRI